MAIETEVKLRLTEGAASARLVLERLGYLPRVPRTLEVSQLYDRAGDELQFTGRALRLRSAGGQWVLTFKGPADGGPHKSREEHETRVDDGAAMERILLALGYSATFQYEKYRTTFTHNEDPGLVMLDETPMGDFMELEGHEDWIDRTTEKLGYLTKDYILTPYPALYAEYRKQHSNLPRNMVFSKKE